MSAFAANIGNFFDIDEQIVRSSDEENVHFVFYISSVLSETFISPRTFIYPVLAGTCNPGKFFEKVLRSVFQMEPI